MPLTRRNGSIYSALQSVFPEVLFLPGTTNVVTASYAPLPRTPEVMFRRLQNLKIATRLISPNYIKYLFTNDRFFEIRDLLAREKALPNTDMEGPTSDAEMEDREVRATPPRRRRRAMATILSELIHPTAVIDPEVVLVPDVRVGPYAVIEGPVEVGPGCVIEAHASLSGPLTLGRDNFVGHGAVLGKSPQHRGYQGEETSVRIGDDNVFREFVTIHRGTVQGGGTTWIGDRNMFMIGSHVGHDARIGSGCTVVNYALVAGHVTLDDGCVLSGHTAVQQRVRIGRLAMLGGMAATSKDIPPFVLQQGYNCVTGLNVVGLRRSGCSSTSIDGLRQAFRIFYREGRSQGCALDQIEADLGSISEVAEFVGFIRQSRIGINPARAPNERTGASDLSPTAANALGPGIGPRRAAQPRAAEAGSSLMARKTPRRRPGPNRHPPGGARRPDLRQGGGFRHSPK